MCGAVRGNVLALASPLASVPNRELSWGGALLKNSSSKADPATYR